MNTTIKINEAYQENFAKLADWEQTELMDLKKFLEDGGVPTIVLFSVNANGTSRKMTFLWVKENKLQRLNCNLIRKLRGEKQVNTWNFKVDGFGMDMVLALLMDIKNVLGVKNSSQAYDYVSFKD